MSTTEPPPASQTEAGAPPPPVIEGGATIFIPPFDPRETSKQLEASTSPEVLAWLRTAWSEWDARPQAAVALVYRACQAAGFTPQPDSGFRGFMAWLPNNVADATQTRVITATPARQPASQQTTTVAPTWGDFPASLPEVAETATSVTTPDKVARKAAKRVRKTLRRARRGALLSGVAAALAGVAGVIAGATGGWAAFAAALVAALAGVAGVIAGINVYSSGRGRRRPRR